MSNSEKLLVKYIENNIGAIKALHREQCFEQSLVVLYALIDTVGLVDNQFGKTSANRTTFKNWINTYVNVSSLNVSADDIYAARCGILHSFSSESDLSRKGRAKEIQYYLDQSNSEGFKILTQSNHQTNVITVPLIEFFNEIKSGMEKMIVSIDFKNAEVQSRISSILRRYVLNFDTKKT
jgi:hypothetical protein